MSANFTVEDGTIVTAANSYATVAYADDYNLNHDADAVWIALTTANKQSNLRKATAYLDRKYGPRWLGTRLGIVQVLDWPRSGMYTRDDFSLANDEIPDKLMAACVEAAIRSANGESLFPDIDPATNGGTISYERVKIGPIEESKSYAGGKSQLARYPIIDSLLTEFIGPGGTYPVDRG
jgi:hypothetical protein